MCSTIHWRQFDQAQGVVQAGVFPASIRIARCIRAIGSCRTKQGEALRLRRHYGLAGVAQSVAACVGVGDDAEHGVGAVGGHRLVVMPGGARIRCVAAAAQ